MSQRAMTWSNQDPKRLSIPLPDGDNVGNVRLSRDYIVVDSLQAVKVYTTRDARLVHSLEAPTDEDEICALDVHENILVTATEAGTICMWDLVSGQCLLNYSTEPPRPAKDLVIALPTIRGLQQSSLLESSRSLEELIISWTNYADPNASMLRVYCSEKPSTGKPFFAVHDPSGAEESQGHVGPILSLDACGDTVITGSQDATARVWDMATCKFVTVKIDGTRAYTASPEPSVHIWDLFTGESLHILKPPPFRTFLHTFPVTISASSLIFSSLDGTLYVWDSLKGRLIYQLEPDVAYTGKYPFFAAFHHDDQKMVYGSRKSLKLCDIRSGKLLVDLLPVDQVQYVTFQGHFCLAHVVRDGAHSLEIWDFGDDDHEDEDED